MGGVAAINILQTDLTLESVACRGRCEQRSPLIVPRPPSRRCCRIGLDGAVRPHVGDMTAGIEGPVCFTSTTALSATSSPTVWRKGWNLGALFENADAFKRPAVRRTLRQ